MMDEPDRKRSLKWDDDPEAGSIELAAGVGRVTGFREKGGKLIADTESGVPVILPIPSERK